MLFILRQLRVAPKEEVMMRECGITGRRKPQEDPLLDFGGFWKMLQLGGHVQDVREMLLQDHDQIM